MGLSKRQHRHMIDKDDRISQADEDGNRRQRRLAQRLKNPSANMIVVLGRRMKLDDTGQLLPRRTEWE